MSVFNFALAQPMASLAVPFFGGVLAVKSAQVVLVVGLQKK